MPNATADQPLHIMPPPELCERARLARDARFDGRFFIGVKTTRIYCRPICPVRMPLAKNVRYYPSAAAAAEAGFRPCLRCRPEVSPGAPAWIGSSTTVGRALRLIGEGFLDRSSVEELGASLGIGPRHLGRLFISHLGASPNAVAQTRRLHFAKRLLDETRLGMSEIALSSGFGSIRRFNDAFRKTYGRTPRDLRRGSLPDAVCAATGNFTFRLAYRPPFDWNSMVEFFAGRATSGVERIDENGYSRTIRLGENAGIIRVRPADEGPGLLLRVEFPEPSGLFKIVERVRRMFDLAAVPQEIASHLARDPALRPIVKRAPGLRVPVAWDGFELGIRAILGQQVTVKAATTITSRLARIYGEPLGEEKSDAVWLLFPSPEILAEADAGRLHVPESRSKAIRALSRATLEGRVRFDGSMDPQSFMSALKEVPGIGEWTAQYVAIRALGEPDAFPASDLGLIRVMEALGEHLTPVQLLARAEAWRPWRSYAALLLWRSLGANQKREETRSTKRAPRAQETAESFSTASRTSSAPS